MNNKTMAHVSVTSSVAHSIGHDPDTNTMEIHFKRGGIYTYDNVDVAAFELIRDAGSVGKAINEFRKDRHERP